MTGRLPCPFCGMRPKVGRRLPEGYALGCGRVRCPVRPSVVAPTREAAVQAWNARPAKSAFVRMFDAALEVLVQVRDDAAKHGGPKAAARRFLKQRIGYLMGLERRARKFDLEETCMAMMDALDDCHEEIARRKAARSA